MWWTTWQARQLLRKPGLHEVGVAPDGVVVSARRGVQNRQHSAQRCRLRRRGCILPPRIVLLLLFAVGANGRPRRGAPVGQRRRDPAE